MAEEKLRLIAEAMGCDETAKAVDVLAEAQKRLKDTSAQVETVRAEGTVAELGAITQAQRELQQAVDLLSGSQTEANAGLGDMVGLLRLIDPRLGSMTGALGRAGRSIVEMATKSHNLGEVLGGLRGLLTSNASALLSMATAGAAVFGITMLAKAYQGLQRDVEQVNKAMEAQRELLTKSREGTNAQRQTIEALADRQVEGRFAPDEARKAQQVAAGIMRKAPELEESAVNRAVAGLFGTGASTEEMERAAFLVQTGRLQFGDRATGNQRLEAARRRIVEHPGPLQRFAETAAVRNRERPEEAHKEFLSDPGPTAAMRELINQRFGDLPAQEVDAMLSMLRGQAGGVREIYNKDENPVPLVTAARLEELKNVMRPVVINQSQYNGRYVGPDGHAQRRRMRNGQSQAREQELLGGG